MQDNNGPAAGGRLSWSVEATSGGGAVLTDLNFDENVKSAIKNGKASLDVFGFVVLAGDFELVKQTLSIDDGDTSGTPGAVDVPLFTADALSLSLTNLGMFVGVGGGLTDPAVAETTVKAPDADALGFYMPSGASLDLVLLLA